MMHLLDNINDVPVEIEVLLLKCIETAMPIFIKLVLPLH
jgi:hypothetical protein